MTHEAKSLGCNRRQLLALAASAAVAGPLGAQAQDRTHFAARPLRVVVPFAAGGATDVIARVLGERMGQRFGQSVVVDNKPGAAGLIAGEAVAKANNTPYGLSAGVWTEKGSRILWMADRLKAGVVWANTFNRFDPTSPFGGYKESGYGREGGKQGLAAYLRSGDVAPRSLSERSETKGEAKASKKGSAA